MAYLSRNEVWGEVERRRSGVREGEGRAREKARTTLPNCVQQGDSNLASTALQKCTTSVEREVTKVAPCPRPAPPKIEQSCVSPDWHLIIRRLCGTAH